MATPERAPSLPRDPDQRVFLRGVSWEDFERILAIRGESGGVRVTYLEGELELMSPSRSHEGIKKALARILEAFALERGLVLEGFGSWTLRRAERERAVEPDECYVLTEDEKDYPDLAIEVIWTSGGLDKLEVYRGLGVGEVWLWQDHEIHVYELEGSVYRPRARSALLPDLNLDTVARCVRESSTQSDAVRSFLAELRGGSRS